MDHVFAATRLLEGDSVAGAVALGMLVFALASLVNMLVRRATRRIGERLTDVTVLRFASTLVQWLVYLFGLVLFAHMIPALRAVGTALLAGASVLSIVVGLAAQDTLGNLIAGLSLVLSHALRVGDEVRLYSPVGVIPAKVKAISLAFTVLVDDDGNDLVVPNNVMMNSAVLRIAKPPAVPCA